MDRIGAVLPIDVTGAVPDDNAVTLPYASIVTEEFVADVAPGPAVARSSVGVKPPVDVILPVVPETLDTLLLAVENAELAYEPADVAVVFAVFAIPNAALAYVPALNAFVDAVFAVENALLA